MASPAGLGGPSRFNLAAGFAAIYLIWGTTYLAIRFAIDTIPPFLMGGIRFVFAGVALYIWARARGAARPRLSEWGAAGIAGALMFLVGQGGVVWAEQRVPSGLTAVMIALVPFWMLLMNWVRPGGSRPSVRSMVGLAVGFAGVLLLVGPVWRGGAESLDPWGVAAIVLSTICWAAGSLYTRSARLPSSVRLATAMEMLMGAALLLLVGSARGEWSRLALDKISLPSGLALAYLVVFGSLIALTAYTWLLSVSTPARVSTYAFVNPAIAVFLGWAFRDEVLNARTLAAAVVIVAAVAIVVTGKGNATGHDTEPTPAELVDLVPEGAVPRQAPSGGREGWRPAMGLAEVRLVPASKEDSGREPVLRKPDNLLYGLEDKPPLSITVLLGLQHVFVVFISFIFPVLIIKQMGSAISPSAAEALISLSMVASGVTTILQGLKKGPVGSGFLCPAVSGPAYFDASKAAVAAGGLPMMFGMTAIAGLMEMLFSRVMRRLRFLFPTEVTGLVAAMVGMVVVPLAVESFFGVTADVRAVQPKETFVAIATLGVMVGLNVWGRGKLKLFSAIIGMVTGYLLSFAFGIVPKADIDGLAAASLVAIPWSPGLTWAFDWAMLVPLVVASISSTLKTVGDLANCQKANDADWKRLDMRPVSRGILADGIGGVIPGVIGGYGQSTSSANIGLSIATGATSRVIAYSTGSLLLLLAFFPKLAQCFIIMPRPVMGAALLFSASFMIIAGFEIILSRMLDARRVFVVGISLVLGLSVSMLPGIYDNVHPWVRPLFSSMLSLATVSAILLNLVFRIGVKKRVTLTLTPGTDSSEAIYHFMIAQGNAWGARREIVDRASYAMNEVFEVLLESGDAQAVVFTVSFDEFNLDVEVAHPRGMFAGGAGAGGGVPPGAAEPGAAEPGDLDALLSLDDFEIDGLTLALALLRHYADRVKMGDHDGRTVMRLHWEH